jgi:hypothetical protein
MTSAGMIRVTERDISELMAGNQWQGRAGRTKFFAAEISRSVSEYRLFQAEKNARL